MALDPTTRNFIVSTYPQYAQSIDTLSAIPGFDFQTQGGYDRIASHPGSFQSHQRARYSGLVLSKKALDKASTDPIGFVYDNMRWSIDEGNADLLKQTVSYLQKNNVPLSDIQSAYENRISF